MESKGPNDLANALDDVNPHILHMLEGPYNIYRKGTIYIHDGAVAVNSLNL